MNFETALSKLRPGSSWSLKTTEYKDVVWLDKTTVKPTEEEIQAKIEELLAAEPMRLLRQERNRRLADVDWITLKAYSQKQDLSEDWANYMQALRDLPANSKPQLDEFGNLTSVTWPEIPE